MTGLKCDKCGKLEGGFVSLQGEYSCTLCDVCKNLWQHYLMSSGEWQRYVIACSRQRHIEHCLKPTREEMDEASVRRISAHVEVFNLACAWANRIGGKRG